MLKLALHGVDALILRGLLARTGDALGFDNPFFGAWVRAESPPGL